MRRKLRQDSGIRANLRNLLLKLVPKPRSLSTKDQKWFCLKPAFLTILLQHVFLSLEDSPDLGDLGILIKVRKQKHLIL